MHAGVECGRVLADRGSRRAAGALRAASGSSALPAFRLDSWTTANGLPSNTISVVRQTRDGYLWLATDNGLARFDGIRFTIFSKSETAGIAGSRFLALWESSAGDLWAGTIDGGVSRYRDGRFTAFSTKDGLTSNVVRRIDEDAAGAIWAYHDSGVSTWRDGRWHSVALPAPPIPDCPTAPSFTSVMGDPWGTGAGTRRAGRDSPTAAGPSCRCRRGSPIPAPSKSAGSSKTRSAGSGSTCSIVRANPTVSATAG